MMRIMSSVGPVRRGGRSMAQVWMVRHPSSSCGSRRGWRRGSRAPRGSSLRHRGACVSRRPRISIETTWELWRLGEDRRDAEDGLRSHWGVSERPQPFGRIGQRPARSVPPGVPSCGSEPSIDDKAGIPHEQPSPCRLSWPVDSVVGVQALCVITRRTSGSGWHIETVGVVLSTSTR